MLLLLHIHYFLSQTPRCVRTSHTIVTPIYVTDTTNCNCNCVDDINTYRKDSLYRMGHEKVARLPFCTCPCDILSDVSMCIA